MLNIRICYELHSNEIEPNYRYGFAKIKLSGHDFNSQQSTVNSQQHRSLVDAIRTLYKLIRNHPASTGMVWHGLQFICSSATPTAIDARRFVRMSDSSIRFNPVFILSHSFHLFHMENL